jgi:hypothetical protein
VNEAEILSRLDERGRRAAASLRGATVGLDLMPPDPAFVRPPRRPVQRVVLVAAVIVVLGAGVAAVVTRVHDRGRDGDPPADDPVDQNDGPLHLGATWLPDGFRPIFAVHDEFREENEAFGPVVVWGGPDAMSSVAGPSMLATTYLEEVRGKPWLEPWLEMHRQVPGDPNLEVQGSPATFKSGVGRAPQVDRGSVSVLIADGMNALQFEPEGDRQAIIASRRLDRKALVRIAEAARLVDGELTFDPATLPAGWSALHEGAFGDMPGGWGGPGASKVGYDGGAGAGAGSVTVHVGRGDHRRVDALHAVAEEVQNIEVRGHEASTGRVRWSSSFMDVRRDALVLMWEERPGVVVYLEGERIELDELQRIAEGLVPITDEEFAALSPQALSESSGGRPLASGTTDGSDPWWMFARLESLSDTAPDASLRVAFELEFEDGSGALPSFHPAMPMSEVGPGTAAIRVEVLAGYGSPIVFGVVPDGAVRVEARSSDGSVTEAGLYDLPDDRLGVDAVMAEVPISSTWVDVVAIDGNGSEIATTRVEIPAS